MKFNNFRRITGSDGNIIGSVKGKTVFDNFGSPVFRITKANDGATKYIRDSYSGRISGTIDKESGCMYDVHRHYIGTLQPREGRNISMRILPLVCLVFASSFYLMLGSIKRANENSYSEPLTLICVPQADGAQDWSRNNTLNIFNQGVRTLPDGTVEKYSLDSGIIPEDSGLYGFTLSNENSSAIEYQITLSEENEARIPIKYRLKMSGEYIAGSEDEWLDIENFNADNLKLTRYSSMQFQLEWKWDGSNDLLDTQIGTKELADYLLTITLKANYIEQV